ncbi:AMP-binding protein [Saccharomonospora sp. NPDC006951]
MDPARLLRRVSHDYRDRVAVRCEDKALTYAEFGERSNRLANALADLGLEKGDRIALLGDNRLESLELIVGTAIGGFVRCSLHAHDAPERHRYLIEHTGAKALIVDRHYYERMSGVLGEIAGLRHVIVLGGPHGTGGTAGVSSYEDVLASASAEQPGVELAQDDPHVIRFSSGTTGLPKGIIITVAATMGMGNEFAVVLPGFDDSDRYLAAGPLTHAAGMFIYPLLAAGTTTIVMPGFDPGKFLELVEREKVTATLVVPTMIQMITDHPDAKTRDLSSLRAVMYGAAPISETTLGKALDVWGDIMYQLYGQSEVVPIAVLMPRHHRLGSGVLSSAGRPSPNAWVRIEDEDGNELPRGQVGEVVAGAPCMMTGIWGDDEAAAVRLTPDGGVRTRDMGYLSEDGFLYLADRKEDMINSGGFNIWPAELENALSAHPAVQDVAVVGVPHEKWGETPCAVVVVREGADVTEAELIEWTRERVGSYKKVTGVRFVAELPKTPLGKILRRQARERYLATGDGLGRA